jgi:hypothetical protein
MFMEAAVVIDSFTREVVDEAVQRGGKQIQHGQKDLFALLFPPWIPKTSSPTLLFIVYRASLGSSHGVELIK